MGRNADKEPVESKMKEKIHGKQTQIEESPKCPKTGVETRSLDSQLDVLLCDVVLSLEVEVLLVLLLLLLLLLLLALLLLVVVVCDLNVAVIDELVVVEPGGVGADLVVVVIGEEEVVVRGFEVVADERASRKSERTPAIVDE